MKKVKKKLWRKFREIEFDTIIPIRKSKSHAAALPRDQHMNFENVKNVRHTGYDIVLLNLVSSIIKPIHRSIT